MDIVFFPRQDYPVEVCLIRYGKKAAYNEHSDALRDGNTGFASTSDVLEIAKEHGIRVSVFASDHDAQDYINLTKQEMRNGNLWLDAYFHLYNPDTGIRYATKAAYEADVTTPERRDLCYDYTKNIVIPTFVNNYGRKPVGHGYSLGITDYDYLVFPDFLAGRGIYDARGGTSDGRIDYYQYYPTPVMWINRRCTSRWYDSISNALAEEDIGSAAYWDIVNNKLAEVEDKIDQAIEENGFYCNFMHWHYIRSVDLPAYEAYFDMLATKKDDLWFCGHGEAAAYIAYRQIITKAVMYSPNSDAANKLVIRLETINNLNIDTDLLQVPISVKFSTVGTPLAGQTIKSSHNLISLGSGEYIVEIPYAEYPGAVIEKVST